MRVLLLLITLVSATSWGGNLTAPNDLDSTGILPKGIRSPRYKQVFLSMEDKFTLGGESRPLGFALNKTLTFQDLVNSQKTEKDRQLAQGVVQANGLNLGDSPGATTGRINTFVDVKVPVMSYGLTDRTTLALAVPFYDIQVSADTGFVSTQKGQDWLMSVYNSNPEKAAEIEKRMQDPANASATDMGYERIQSERVQAMGDIKLISKSQLYKTDRNVVALKTAVTFPTGTPPNADKVVDTATGDGQWDLGARVLWDQKFGPMMTLGTFAGYTAQLPDRLERRIPLKQGQSLSPEKEEVFRDSGDQMDVGVQFVGGSGTGGLSAGLGYTYQYMTQTHFQGNRFNGQHYRWLEESYPEQDIHSLTLGVSYSTVDDFKSGRFVLPVQTNFSVSHPTAGRNTATSEVYSGELVLFF